MWRWLPGLLALQRLDHFIKASSPIMADLRAQITSQASLSPAYLLLQLVVSYYVLYMAFYAVESSLSMSINLHLIRLDALYTM
jgi:hypothetical protein